MSSSDTTSLTTQLCDLVSSIHKESVEAANPNAERCSDILNQIESLFSNKNKKQNTMTVSILLKTQAGKTLNQTLKAMKRHRRSANTVMKHSDETNQTNEWEIPVTKCDTIISSWKEIFRKETELNAQKKKSNTKSTDTPSGSPSSVSNLRDRLVKQKKEIYKDPPVLPPPSTSIYTSHAPLPTRSKVTGELIFITIDGYEDDVPSLSQFRPNRTPAQILQGGAFGGTYFRAITSAITNERYHPSQVISTSLQADWIPSNLDPKLYLSSQTYRPHVNKFKAKCGGSLGMWESSGWISDTDPYGWFQWYCRFYSGRRCSDDERQIGRWCKIAGTKGRFLSQLCNKCLKAGKRANDVSISPVIRQTLWHWGIELTDTILERHKKRIGSK